MFALPNYGYDDIALRVHLVLKVLTLCIFFKRRDHI